MNRFLASSLLLLSACGINTGNATVAVTMGLVSEEFPDAPATTDSQGTVFGIATGEANIRDIRLDFQAGTSCDDFDAAAFEAPVSCSGNTVQITGPFRLNLADRTVTPSLDNVLVPAVAYERIDVRFDPADPDDGLVTADELLADHSIVMTGTTNLEGVDTNYQLRLAFSEDARFENETGGIDLSANSADILLLLQVDAWFANLPITQCVADGDLEVVNGLLSIEDSNGGCSDIENTLKEAIKLSGQLDKE